MKRSSRELKALARESLKGHYGTLIGAFVLLIIFSSVLDFISNRIQANTRGVLPDIALQLLLSLIISILIYLMEIGIFAMILHMARGEAISVGQLFYAFAHSPNRFIILTVIQMIITQIPLIPAMVYGQTLLSFRLLPVLTYLGLFLAGYLVSIIIMLGFALSDLLLIEDEDMGAVESIRQSFSLMKGNKGRYFYLQISFIGLFLLSAFTLFIGLLWIVPYMLTTEIYFYLDVTGELDQPYTDDFSGSNYGFREDHWNTSSEYDGYNTEA